MKLILLSLCSLCFCTLTHSQSTKAIYIKDYENDVLLLKYSKTLKEVIYSYTFKKNEIIDSAILETRDYNILGNLIQLVNYGGKNPTTTSFAYLYDSTGKILKATKNNSGTVNNYEFDYDSLGNLITKYDYNIDTTYLIIEQFKYNSNNKVEQLLTKINNSDPYISRKYFYDEQNRLIKTDALDAQGSDIYSYSFEYRDNQKSTFLNNIKGQKLETVTISDSSGKRIQRKYPLSNRDDYFKYYNDGTIFEWEVVVGGIKQQLIRHFYYR